MLIYQIKFDLLLVIVKNALDRARMRQANRIFDSRGQVLTKKELVNLEAQDILQSTVFN